MNYYPINEELARRAKAMSSYSDYVPGSATAHYRSAVDQAARLAEQQKLQVDPIHHEKIDRLLDAYARRLAEYINKDNEIATRVPSILVAGGSNFPVRKKEKQNRAAEANMAEWRQIQGLLDKIRSTGKGGISADDPDVVQKLQDKLKGLEQDQERMKAVNAYYRKHKTLDGCPHISPGELEKVKAAMARSWRADPKPYESYALANNNANIRQTKKRIAELIQRAETEYVGWDFEGGTVSVDRQANRLQVFFDEKPDRETCSAMRHSGFKWAPSVGAWQRQLNDNAIYAAKHLEFLQPVQEQPQMDTASAPDSGWSFYVIADLKTWADNAENRSPVEYYSTFEEAKARFVELRGENYNNEVTDHDSDGRSPARLTLGLESADGMSAVDILHVRQGKNYLITDFSRTDQSRDDLAVRDILSRVSREIGFDFVRDHEQIGDRYRILPNIPFEEWDNRYFSSVSAGSIAARYYDLLHECYPLPRDEDVRSEQITEIIQFLQKEGKTGANQLTLSIASLVDGTKPSEIVQKQAEALIVDLAQYKGGIEKPQQKERHHKSQER